MLIQQINSYKYYNSDLKKANKPVSNKTFTGKPVMGDVFIKQANSDEFLKNIDKIKEIALNAKIPYSNISSMLKSLNEINCKAFLNMLVYSVTFGEAGEIFDSKNSKNYKAQRIINSVNTENKEFVEKYVELGGWSEKHIKEWQSYAGVVDALYPRDFFPTTMDDLLDWVSPINKDLIIKTIDKFEFPEHVLILYFNSLYDYTGAEISNFDVNLEKGLADYLNEIMANRNHPFRKNLNTIDFINKSPESVNQINNMINNRIKFIDLLKFPFEDKKHFDKVLRDACSLMGKVYENEINQAVDEYQARRDLDVFFSEKLNSVIGMIAFTDKETVLHIFDKGLENTDKFINTQNRLTYDDFQILSDVVRKGKVKNKNGEYVPISAKDKVYIYNLVNINRTVFARSNDDIDFKSAITRSDNNQDVYIDFKQIEEQIHKKVLKKYGFTEEELQKLNPKDLDWDSRYIHLLASKAHDDEALDIIVKEASKGNFVNYINDTSNDYGAVNQKTKEIFNDNGLNFEAWENGISEGEFKVKDEKLKISLWKRRPQSSLFNGSYTTCCTSLDGAQWKSMPEYILNKVFNIMEVKNEQGDTIAQSRMYMINKSIPALIVDNIEVNNTFKKKLATDKLKDEFIENIFSYIRKYAKTLAPWEIPVYFSTENNKIYTSRDLTGYPKLRVYIDSIVGELNSDTVYCNANSDCFSDLLYSTAIFYNISKPPKDKASGYNLLLMNDF